MDGNKNGFITRDELFQYYRDQQPIETDVSEDVGYPCPKLEIIDSVFDYQEYNSANIARETSEGDESL